VEWNPLVGDQSWSQLALPSESLIHVSTCLYFVKPRSPADAAQLLSGFFGHHLSFCKMEMRVNEGGKGW
jgi:hypothetical protein